MAIIEITTQLQVKLLQNKKEKRFNFSSLSRKATQLINISFPTRATGACHNQRAHQHLQRHGERWHQHL